MKITRHNVSSFNIGTFSYNEAPPSSLSSGVLVQEIRSISCLSCGVSVWRVSGQTIISEEWRVIILITRNWGRSDDNLISWTKPVLSADVIRPDGPSMTRHGPQAELTTVRQHHSLLSSITSTHPSSPSCSENQLINLSSKHFVVNTFIYCHLCDPLWVLTVEKLS